MNVVKEIHRINDAELKLGISGASWHDDYKDSAYIFAGGLNTELTEGDVITIFSQYGEIMDINMPRDKDTGKPKGFAFLMYEDQRSTVLAVDNLNGAKVLERTLRVDHVRDYKQPRTKGDDGEWIEPEDQSLNAKPEMIMDEAPASDSSEDSGPEIDPEDPMRDYLLEKRREAKALKKEKKSKSKKKHKDETPEERRTRKERKKEKRRKKEEKSAGVLGVEQLLQSLGESNIRGRDGDGDNGDRNKGRSKGGDERTLERSFRSRSRSPMRQYRDGHSPDRRQHSAGQSEDKYERQGRSTDGDRDRERRPPYRR